MNPSPYPFERWPRVTREAVRALAFQQQLKRRLRAWMATWDARLQIVDAIVTGPRISAELGDHEPGSYQVVLSGGLEGPWSVLELDGALASAWLSVLLGLDLEAGRPLSELEVSRLDMAFLDILSRGEPHLLWTRSGNAMAALQGIFRRDERLIEARVEAVWELGDRQVRGVMRWLGSVAAAARMAATAEHPRGLPDWVLEALVVCVSLGHFPLELETVERLECGDILLVDPLPERGEEDVLSPVAVFPVGLEREARAGRLTRLGEHRAVQIEERAMTESYGIKEALRKAPLALRVELGRVEMSAEKLARLDAGQVLDLGIPLDALVSLYVGERCVGRGELVDVEGQIGVRVVDWEPEG